MDEATIKARVLGHIRRAVRNINPIVTAELSLGSSSVRADLALWADGELIGLEIKTARDTLKRLPAQMSAYRRYFDHAVLVVEPKHLPAATSMDLCGASLWMIEGGEITVQKFGSANTVRPAEFLDLMTQVERRSLIGSSPKTVREHYESVFAKRYQKTSDAFWQAAKGRIIKPEYIRLLSRFSERRQAFEEIAKAKEDRWLRWSELSSTLLAAA